MTALSATIGTGNIAGVATAVFLGGPGALFWMWCTALVGLATKYSEAVCAVKYREVDELGNHVGGPMYYIKNGLSKKWLWLAPLFAIFGALAGFGIGNTVQANSVAAVMESSFSIPPWVTGLVMMVLVGAVLIGGIKRIAQVAGALVPFMAVAYILAGLVVLAVNVAEIPAAFALIFTKAFTPTAAEGGFAGAAVWAAIRFGVARGIFSNEAGLGSAPIAHAAATTTNPVRQGTIAMLGTFIDTIIVCTITGPRHRDHRRLDLRRDRRGAHLGGLRGLDPRHRRLPGDHRAGDLRLHDGAGLELLRREVRGVPAWASSRSRPSGSCGSSPCRSARPSTWASSGCLADTLNAMMALPNLIALLLLEPDNLPADPRALRGAGGQTVRVRLGGRKDKD